MPAGLGSKVLLDTNSLIYSLKQRADIRDLLSRLPEVSGILVPTCVLKELESMSDDVSYARGALSLAKKFKTIEGEGPADDCILELATGHGLFILTNDRGLIERAKALRIRTLSFKGGRNIDFS